MLCSPRILVRATSSTQSCRKVRPLNHNTLDPIALSKVAWSASTTGIMRGISIVTVSRFTRRYSDGIGRLWKSPCPPRLITVPVATLVSASNVSANQTLSPIFISVLFLVFDIPSAEDGYFSCVSQKLSCQHAGWSMIGSFQNLS
ncbi:hypothetical protein M758_UG022700 [Ceratodon purpureus]|nr:hypothetical protein M758_UG022700 [Ceratodon purpureus]